MTSSVPAAIDDCSPAWLTQVLRAAGMVSRGAVASVQHRRIGAAFNSQVAHLDVAWSADASPTAPRQLLLKLNADHEGEAEAWFYQLVASLPDHPRVVPQGYAARYDPTTGNSYLLLEDLSNTHRLPVSREQLLALQGVPTDTDLDSIVDALARFHAYWWERPELGSGVAQVRGWYNSHEAFHRHIERRHREFAHFIDDVGSWFPSDLRSLYERTLAGLTGLWDAYLAARVTLLRQLTLSHGDCYLIQFLCPRAPGAPTYLVDFQAVSANFAPYDLAYLVPTFWTRAQRQADQREASLLRRYHRGLERQGVTGYGWEQLLTDYRLMVTLMIFDPVHDQGAGADQSYWWPKMQCLTAAYQDLKCQDLLAS